MSHISANELMNTVDVFFVQLFGEENYMKWQELKCQLGFNSEQSFVTWILNYVTKNYNLDKLDIIGENVVEENLYEHRSSPDVKRSKRSLQEFEYDNLDIKEIEADAAADNNKEDEAAAVGLQASLHEGGTEVVVPSDQPLGNVRNEDGPPVNSAADTSSSFEVDNEAPLAGVSNNGYTPPGMEEIEELEAVDGGVRGEYRLKCKLCKKYFRYRGDLQRHYKEVHLHLRKHSCEHCGRQFTRSYILRKHLETIHFDMRGHHVCAICAKSFSTKACLQEHEKRYHYNDVAGDLT